MAVGWGDWGLRLYNATMKPAEGLANVSADAYARGKGESVNVDPRYETVVKPKLETVKRKREAKELKRAAIDGIKKYNAEVEHRRRLRSDDREYEVEAQKEAMSQYLNARKDSKALNKVFEAIGAPVRSYENFSGQARPVYQDTVVNPYGPLWSHTKKASEYFDKNGTEALPGAAGQLYLGNSAEERWTGHNDAYPNYQAGHFMSSPYHTKEWVEDDVKYRKILLNPFDMKRVPSSGLWAKGEWAAQNPELAAKRWLPPSFKKAIWGQP